MTAHQARENHTDAVPLVALDSPVSVTLEDVPLVALDTHDTLTLDAGARRVLEALATARRGGERDAWLQVVGACQSLMNAATAVQDDAITEVARREGAWCEDGTLGESVHARGRVTLDAADLVAPAIGASHDQAQRRVEQAVRLAADRVPVPADHRDLPEVSGLHDLHAAMADGTLDGYRAGVVAHELELAPADVAQAVLAALRGHLADDGPTLRRRCRRLLTRISPDLLRQRAERARAETGLRRWVSEPGVDTWVGTFPSEDAAVAWAAIDGRAHDLVASGACSSVEQARGKALTDLVTGSATVDIRVVLTVPADAMPAPLTPTADTMPAPATSTSEAAPTSVTPIAGSSAAPVHDVRWSPADTPDASHDMTQAGRVLPAVSADVAASDSPEDLVQVQGARPSEPLLVRRA